MTTNEWSVKRDIKRKKKKESSRTISYNLENGWRKIIKISIQFHYEREIFRAISETYSIPKKPFQLSERAYFIGNTLEKFHQDLRFRKTFTKLSPCEEDFFHNRANKILLQSLSLSLQISTDLFLYPQRYNREGKRFEKGSPSFEISFEMAGNTGTDYITESRG